MPPPASRPHALTRCARCSAANAPAVVRRVVLGKTRGDCGVFSLGSRIPVVRQQSGCLRCSAGCSSCTGLKTDRKWRRAGSRIPGLRRSCVRARALTGAVLLFRGRALTPRGGVGGVVEVLWSVGAGAASFGGSSVCRGGGVFQAGGGTAGGVCFVVRFAGGVAGWRKVFPPKAFDMPCFALAGERGDVGRCLWFCWIVP